MSNLSSMDIDPSNIQNASHVHHQLHPTGPALGNGGASPSAAADDDLRRCPSEIPLTGENADRDDGDGLINITIMEGGHLRLVDSASHVYFFSSDELRQRNIDANALTDDNIHEIIQLAMPQLLTDKSAANGGVVDSGLSSKRRRLVGGETLSGDSKQHITDTSPAYYGSPPASHYGYRVGANYSGGMAYGSQRTQQQAHHQPSHYSNHSFLAQQPTAAGTSNKVLTSTNFSYFRASSASGPPPAASDTSRELADASGVGRVMIGEEMEVKNAEGRVEMAIVRYYRPGTGYKIQFADGHFEWLEEHSVLALKQGGGLTYSVKPPPASAGGNKKAPQRVALSASGGGTQFRRVGPPVVAASSSSASSYHQNHSSMLASTSAAADDENGASHHNGRKSPHVAGAIVHNRPVQYRSMAMTFRQRQHSQHAAYRDGVLPPSNITGMRVTLSEDAYGNGYARNGYALGTMQNLDDEELLAEPLYHQPHQHSMEYMPASDGGGAYPQQPESFYCAVCDRNCPHDSASFVVIRIPACVDCVGKKTVIADDELDGQIGSDVVTIPDHKTVNGDAKPSVSNAACSSANVAAASNVNVPTRPPTPGRSLGREENLIAVDGYDDLRENYDFLDVLAD